MRFAVSLAALKGFYKVTGWPESEQRDVDNLFDEPAQGSLGIHCCTVAGSISSPWPRSRQFPTDRRRSDSPLAILYIVSTMYV
jgi:hypothetical protein